MFIRERSCPDVKTIANKMKNRNDSSREFATTLCANHQWEKNGMRALTIPEGDDQKKPVSKERDGMRRHGIEGLFVTAWLPTYDWSTTAVFNHRAIRPWIPRYPYQRTRSSRRIFAQAFARTRRGHEFTPDAKSTWTRESTWARGDTEISRSWFSEW